MSFSHLHTVSGFIILVALVGKILLHYYLDYVSGKGAGFASFIISPVIYFRPYKAAVPGEFFSLKRVCNLLLRIAGLSLLTNIIVGVLIYLQ